MIALLGYCYKTNTTGNCVHMSVFWSFVAFTTFAILITRGAVVNVTSLIDSSTIDASQCANNGTCNYRNAFSYCSAIIAPEPCIINLPSHSNISLDPAYGSFALKSTTKLYINGNNSIITGNMDLSSSSTGSVAVTTNIPYPFPWFYYGYLTAYATTNLYYPGCVTLNKGDVIEISACNSGFYGDTYFRLYYNNYTQVAYNDDYCGLGSQITYTAAQTGDYCVALGCTADDFCEAFLTATVTTGLNPAGNGPTGILLNNSLFPMNYEVMDTNSALQNTVNACLNLSFGDMITFSGCTASIQLPTDDYGYIGEDTYFRLFLEDGEVEIAENNEGCSGSIGSLISYVSTYEGSNSFCLHAGCYGSTACIGYVTATYYSAANIR